MSDAHVVAKVKELAKQQPANGDRIIAKVKELAKQQLANSWNDC